MSHSKLFNQSKYFLTLAIIISIIIAIPTQALAVTTAQQVASDALFCQNVAQINARITAKMQSPIATIAAHPNTATKATSQQILVNSKLQSVRSNWDNKRNEYFNKMLEKTKSDSQKSAVNSFKDNVNIAIQLRRADIDAATQLYFNSIQDLQQQYNQTVINSSNAFQSDVTQSFASASHSCDSAVDINTIRTELTNNLKSAKLKLFSTQQNAKNQVIKINNLRTIETKSINESINTYKNNIDNAKTQLINDLKNSKEDTSHLTLVSEIAS